MALPDLTNEFAADTYKGILHTSNVPVSGANLPPVYDGLGYKSALKLGSDGNGASFTGTLSADNFTLHGYVTIIDYLYPVGAVYLDTLDVNPQTRFSGTTWGKISEGRFLAGVGEGTDQNLNNKTITSGDNDGSYTHILSQDEMPSHTHTPAENNEYPYIVTWPYLGSISRQEAGNDSNDSYLFPNQRPQAQTLSAVGGGMAHENTPPGFGVYIWKRLS
jgi:hypothetical protein